MPNDFKRRPRHKWTPAEVRAAARRASPKPEFTEKREQHPDYEIAPDVTPSLWSRLKDFVLRR
jgi:hypothetical protein